MYDYFSENKLFHESQYGFRKGHSTEHAILELYDRILQDVEKKRDPFAVFLDLSKAFDTIDHNILISKLTHYGIRGVALNWFKSYLSNRSQYVVIEGVKSNCLGISTGVPQGSILGPLLFIIYINDLARASKLLRTICFADDSNLLCSLRDLAQTVPAGESVIQAANNELQKIADWMAVNKLSLNASKTRLMVFHYRQRTGPSTPLNEDEDQRLYKNGERIKQVREFLFLGIWLNSDLTWTKQINMLAAKIGKSVGILNRLKRFIPHNVLKMIYNSLILSRLNYCILAWGYDLARLTILQKKAIRAVNNERWPTHTEPLFKSNKLLKLEDIFKLRCLKFYYQLINRTLPPYFFSMLPTADHTHNYNTRQAADLHHQRTTRTIGASKCIRNKILNDIITYEPLVIEKVHTHSFQGFSNYAKNFMIDLYSPDCQNGPNCYACNYVPPW